jgi:hypothetical protein
VVFALATIVVPLFRTTSPHFRTSKIYQKNGA